MLKGQLGPICLKGGGGELKCIFLVSIYRGYFETSFNVGLPPGTLKVGSTYLGGILKLGEVT